MTDPLSTASALLAVVTAAIQSSKMLYETVQSFRDQPRVVRQLQGELHSLYGVLESLHALVEREATFFAPLELPLRQCRKACGDFRVLVLKCTAHSDGTKPSVRDWLRLRFMDTDIRGFTEMLSGYKSTVSVALADANLRSSTVTRKVLDEYKDMIRVTTQDLEAHLEEINAKLQSLAPPGPPKSAVTPEDVRWFERERQSTKHCLEICAQGMSRIDELRPQLTSGRGLADRTYAEPGSVQNLTFAEVMTLFALKKCSDDLALHLRAKEEQAGQRAHLDSAETGGLGEPAADGELQRLAGESDSTKQCLAVLRGASERASSGGMHVVEDVEIGMDGEQMLITSSDQLFSVKRVTLDNRARQVVMSSSSEAVQEFLKGQNRR